MPFLILTLDFETKVLCYHQHQRTDNAFRAWPSLMHTHYPNASCSSMPTRFYKWRDHHHHHFGYECTVRQPLESSIAPLDYHDQISVDLWLCTAMRHSATFVACAMTSGNGTCGGLKAPRSPRQDNLVTKLRRIKIKYLHGFTDIRKLIA